MCRPGFKTKTILASSEPSPRIFAVRKTLHYWDPPNRIRVQNDFHRPYFIGDPRPNGDSTLIVLKPKALAFHCPNNARALRDATAFRLFVFGEGLRTGENQDHSAVVYVQGLRVVLTDLDPIAQTVAGFEPSKSEQATRVQVEAWQASLPLDFCLLFFILYTDASNSIVKCLGGRHLVR